MFKCTEAEFKQYASNGVISVLKIVRTPEKEFTIIIELTWKDGEHTLYTFRNIPRTWASLDRLMMYLDRQGLRNRTVTLIR